MKNKIAEALVYTLANTYKLASMTQICHWNVLGPQFFSLHSAFGSQYEVLAASVDTIAERVRALEVMLPSSLNKLLDLSTLKEGRFTDSDSMVASLLKAHEDCAETSQELAKAIEGDDQATANMLADLAMFHGKTAWMLRSYLG